MSPLTTKSFTQNGVCTFSWLNKTKFKRRIPEVTHFPNWRLALMWKVIQVLAVLAAVLSTEQAKMAEITMIIQEKLN